MDYKKKYLKYKQKYINLKQTGGVFYGLRGLPNAIPCREINLEHDTLVFLNAVLYYTDTTVEVLTNSSVYGCILVINISPTLIKCCEDGTYGDYTFRHLDSGKAVNKLLLKLCLCSTMIEEDYKLLDVSKSTVTYKDFESEIKIHNQVYKKTLTNLRPVCPGICASYNLGYNNKYSQHILTELYNKGDESVKAIIKSLIALMAEKQYTLGAIFMKFLEGFVTLTTIINNPINSNRKRITLSDEWERDPTLYDYSLSLTMYEIYRFANAGYTHGDLHLDNVMINLNYNQGYLTNGSGSNIPGRALIIDFGRSEEQPFQRYPDIVQPNIILNNELSKYGIFEHYDVYDWLRAPYWQDNNAFTNLQSIHKFRMNYINNNPKQTLTSFSSDYSARTLYDGAIYNLT